jgi:transposase
MVVAGGAWRMMPHDFPKWQTVYDYFRNWKNDGTFESMNTQLSKYLRVMEGRRESPSASILDSQSVQTATMAHNEVGYDANKKDNLVKNLKIIAPGNSVAVQYTR